jgi:hypothetical protein
MLVASTPSEWVDSVTLLLDDPKLRNRLGAAGRAFVEGSHDWERCLDPFVALLGLDHQTSGESGALIGVEMGEVAG